MKTIVCLSDTHGYHRSVTVPDGDIVIHAGDSTNDAGQASLRDFLTWFEALPHKHKIFIAGNHDFAFEKWPDLARAMVKEVAPSCTYLQDSGCEIDGKRFWGSPVQPAFFNWAFNRERGDEIRRHWDMIPRTTDVLITHGPPWGYLDVSGFGNDHVGCRDLYAAINEIQPDLHVFGHIHHSYGQHKFIHDLGNWTWLLNCSICDEGYKPTRKPWIIEI